MPRVSVSSLGWFSHPEQHGEHLSSSEPQSAVPWVLWVTRQLSAWPAKHPSQRMELDGWTRLSHGKMSAWIGFMIINQICLAVRWLWRRRKHRISKKDSNHILAHVCTWAGRKQILWRTLLSLLDSYKTAMWTLISKLCMWTLIGSYVATLRQLCGHWWSSMWTHIAQLCGHLKGTARWTLTGYS